MLDDPTQIYLSDTPDGKQRIDFTELQRRIRLPLKFKIDLMDHLIEKAVKNHGDKIYVAWSGGKDSTVLVWRAIKIKPDIKVLFNNTFIEHPSTLKFVRDYSKLWNLNFIETKPKMYFRQVVLKEGYPEMRRQNREPLCCKTLKIQPSVDVIKEHKIDCIIDGVTASESFPRRLAGATFGCMYWMKTNMPWRMEKVRPILYWTVEDVWKYIKDNKIPYTPEYDVNLKLFGKRGRVGCMLCTGYIGWDKVMARKLPKLYRKIMKEMREWGDPRAKNLITDFGHN
ncbi:hypothetical protein LCGC14_2435380 [marine sediment metagenome]|uniref:Phosphoadenosine phosphosulphate reductase domain-containing protein n=1 Tax=marine sediment metagenome TaxID=412755 RepID=A0A0F9EEM1_9ZZZZ